MLHLLLAYSARHLPGATELDVVKLAVNNLPGLGFAVHSRSLVASGPRGITMVVHMDGHDGTPHHLPRKSSWYDVEGFDSEAWLTCFFG